MPGLTALPEILRDLRPAVRPGRFAIVSVPVAPPGVEAVAQVVEEEGTTLVLDAAAAAAAGLTHDAGYGWITLQVQTSLDAVGVTAAVATALARAGIACNVLAGYHHDHLLVPFDRVDEAVELLGGLS